MPRRVISCATVALCLAITPAHATDIFPHAAGTAGLRMPVKNFAELRFQNMLKQKYDFSCGSAALASLLTYHYDRPVEEGDVLKAMYSAGDKARISKVGFSLLDMKNYLKAQGLQADGYRASLDLLMKEKIPAIVLINRKGYMHFVVVKGIAKDRVLIGDPSTGLHTVGREEFSRMWNGILFVVTNEMERGRSSFNLAADWNHRKAPGNTSFRESLSNQALDVSPTPFYY